MALELKFYKNNKSAWGFRLTGGADCDIPLTVVKVYEDSIAEYAGLQVEDIVVRINDTPMAGLTHFEAHDVITDAGSEFIMAVRRDENGVDIVQDEEICDIKDGCLENDNNNNLQEIEERNLDDQIAEAISGEAEVLPDQNILGVNFNKVDLSQSTVCKAIEESSQEQNFNLINKKWSTFLQTPERPKVMPKVKDEDIPKAPPYRVTIRRQKKFEEKELNTSAEEMTISTENVVGPDDNNLEEFHNDIGDENSQSMEENEERLMEENCIDNDSLEEEGCDEERYSDNGSLKDYPEPVTEEFQALVKEEEVDAPLSLEQQLAQVQQQLQALAQLPSSIRDSLEEVTSQLAKIVYAKQGREIEDECFAQSAISEIDISEQRTEEEHSELIRTTLEDSLEENEEKYRSHSYCSSVTSELNYDEEAEIVSHVNIIDNYEEETENLHSVEELLEKKQIEHEKLVNHERKLLQLEESHQRRLEQRPTHPLTPLQRQRPIILPGGRRWSQPGDAIPSIKKPKMTDEKICETLDNYSEVIAGHTKGINFLKYQPPAKNLDYLQRSEVYRLIHDEDPPNKGIAARSEVVLSEQDYYQNNDHH